MARPHLRPGVSLRAARHRSRPGVPVRTEPCPRTGNAHGALPHRLPRDLKMARLRELARLIRSKNAGPFELTIDILFADQPTYERVKRSGRVNVELIADMFRLDPEKVRLFHYVAADAIKVSIPRLIGSGGPDETEI